MKKRVIWWVLILIWCGFIFFQSNQPGEISSIQSNVFVDLLRKMLSPFFSPGNADTYSFIVRKTAHFTEYFILGLLLFKGLSNTKKLKKAFAISFMIGFIYAVSDEIHQYFIPGRAMKLFDVFIDSLGIFTGVCILYLYHNKKA
jgi:VanZ family protein